MLVLVVVLVRLPPSNTQRGRERENPASSPFIVWSASARVTEPGGALSSRSSNVFMTMGNQRSAIAGNVAKRRPFSAATASAKDEHTDDQPSGKVEALRRAMLVRGGRSAVLMAVLIFCVTYALLKYWFVVSGVYYDTLEKVQGCVPRNLEIVNDMLEEEYVQSTMRPITTAQTHTQTNKRARYHAGGSQVVMYSTSRSTKPTPPTRATRRGRR